MVSENQCMLFLTFSKVIAAGTDLGLTEDLLALPPPSCHVPPTAGTWPCLPSSHLMGWAAPFAMRSDPSQACTSAGPLCQPTHDQSTLTTAATRPDLQGKPWTEPSTHYGSSYLHTYHEAAPPVNLAISRQKFRSCPRSQNFTQFFFSFTKLKMFTFHLKEVFYGFALVYLNN